MRWNSKNGGYKLTPPSLPYLALEETMYINKIVPLLTERLQKEIQEK